MKIPGCRLCTDLIAMRNAIHGAIPRHEAEEALARIRATLNDYAQHTKCVDCGILGHSYCGAEMLREEPFSADAIAAYERNATGGMSRRFVRTIRERERRLESIRLLASGTDGRKLTSEQRLDEILKLAEGR